jgi:UDPglucose 6-dehydrogenase
VEIFARYGRDLSGKMFALWGLAFKAQHQRHAPSRVVISALLRAGARILAHDPVAKDEARRVLALDLADAPAFLEKLQFMDKPWKPCRVPMG